MKILFLGDIIGKPGRDAVAQHLPRLKGALNPDLIVAGIGVLAAGLAAF